MPSVFLSSTVGDFEDLRGAIRDWLERKGFHVLASDASDFDKGGDANSYAACFAAIKTADHFLLLIGDRRGGLYQNATEPISITRAEYHVALEESKHRHLPIHAFVRKRTWNEKHLFEIERLAPNDELTHQVAFLREVGRVTEMKMAVSGQHEPPANNWIHQFDGFSDIRSALEVNLGLHHDLETQALCNAVGLELELLFAHFLRKTKTGQCHWRSELTRTLRERIQIPLSALGQMLELSRKDIFLLWGATLVPRFGFLPEMQSLERASYWHRFAEHDSIRGSTTLSPLQRSIGRVFSLLKKLRLFENALLEARDSLGNTLSATKGRDDAHLVSVHAMDVIRVFDYSADLDRLERHLVSLGAFFVLGLPYPNLGEDGIAWSPIAGQEEGLQEEKVLSSDVQNFLSHQFRQSV